MEKIHASQHKGYLWIACAIGSFKKGGINLDHVVSIAEFNALPKAKQCEECAVVLENLDQ